MKKFHFILLLAIFACSPDNDEAIVEQQSTSSDTPESMNLESGPALNRDSGNLIYKETFENPELYNKSDISIPFLKLSIRMLYFIFSFVPGRKIMFNF